jgi:hypothetical protein
MSEQMFTLVSIPSHLYQSSYSHVQIHRILTAIYIHRQHTSYLLIIQLQTEACFKWDSTIYNLHFGECICHYSKEPDLLHIMIRSKNKNICWIHHIFQNKTENWIIHYLWQRFVIHFLYGSENVSVDCASVKTLCYTLYRCTVFPYYESVDEMQDVHF